MKLSRILIIFTALLLVFGIYFMIFSIRSRYATTEYQFQVDAVLAAAAVANQEDPLTTDPSRAVIAEYEGRRAVVVPGNYKALSSYLRKDAASPLFASVSREKALKLTVCGEAEFYIIPRDASGDLVLIELTTGGQRFIVRADGGNLWSSLLTCCLEGTYHDNNIPLDSV